MVDTAYLAVNGCELFNAQRADMDISGECDAAQPTRPTGYICTPCGPLAAWLSSTCCDTPPWVDPSKPETSRIDALVWQQHIGLSHNPTTGPREVELIFLVYAEDECAAAAGIDWVADKLTVGDCSTGTACSGLELSFFSCCPDTSSTADIKRAARSIPDCRLAEGPTIEARYTTVGSYQIWQARLLVTTGNTWVVREPGPETTHTAIDGNGTNKTIDLTEGCPPVASCAADPDFPAPTLPTITETIPDPRWPTGAISTNYRHWEIDKRYLPNSQAAVRLNVETGATAMRNLMVITTPNPLGRTCSSLVNSHDWPCRRCVMLVVSYLPPNATFTYDSARYINRIVCDGGDTDRAYTFSGDGRPGTWPYLYCGGTTCLSVAAQSGFDGGARVVISLPMIDRVA